MRKTHIKILSLALVVLSLVSLYAISHYNPHRPTAHADSSCTVTASSLSAITTAASSAASGATVCVAGGTYDGELILSAHPSADITVQPVPGSTVTLTNSDQNVGIAVDFASNAQHIKLHNFYVTSEINIEPGASDIIIDHNDVTGGYFGIAGGGVNCSAPNAPVYPGCGSVPAISNITISGNKLHGFGYATVNNSGIDWPINHRVPHGNNSEDALHFNNFNGLHITANEITDTQEGGNHTDCLQTVWGGSNLTFDHNYEHDNQCQGFFLKDGDVTNVSVTDNLFLSDYVETHDQADLQVINASPITIRNNTFWELQGNLVRAVDASFNPPTTAVDHNVFMIFNALNDSGPAYQVTEDYDIFRTDPYTFFRGANSTISNSPDFTDTATNNYQLSPNPNGIGVDWQPSQYVYGPVPTTPDSGSGTDGGSSGGSDSGSSSGSSTSSSSGLSAGSTVKATTPNKLKPTSTQSSANANSASQPSANQGNLTLTDIAVSKVGQHTATITWKTNQPASSTVHYGQGSNLNITVSEPDKVTDHSVTLNRDFLKPGLLYSAQASSVNGQGNQATSSTVSFQTTGLTLYLKVVDSHGNVLKKALVTAADQTKLTDNQGNVSFDGLPYGDQTVTVVYKGQTTSSSIKLGTNFADDQYKPQNLTLRLAAIHQTSSGIAKLAIVATVVAILVGGISFFVRWRQRPPTSMPPAAPGV